MAEVERKPIVNSDLSVENLWGLLMRSRLFSPDQIKVLQKNWQVAERGNAQDSAHFIEWLVANQCLTAYQAKLLSRGQVDDFFCNQYKILERIGHGSMAGVYKAQDASGRTVAMKVLPPSKAKDRLLLGRFQREARLALRLNHPYVVRAIEMGQAGELHYLVMEFLEGEPLDDVLNRRGKLSPLEAAGVVRQALLGLQHLYEQGVVHRDLKPSNLMLVKTPEHTSVVKIVDVGLGRAATLPTEQAPELQLTNEGSILGTPDYMAPEQAKDARSADIRADVYSLGCVLYHLLTGEPPFTDTNIISLMLRHATQLPRPLRDLIPNAPQALQEIIDEMLAKDPNQRFATPGHAAQALEAFLASQSQPATPAPDSPASKPRKAKDTIKRTRTTAAPTPKTVEADVQLVPFEPTALANSTMRWYQLSRRDWLMIAIGAVAAAGVMALSSLVRAD